MDSIDQQLEHIVFLKLKPFKDNENTLKSIDEIVKEIRILNHGLIDIKFDKNHSPRSQGYNYFLKIIFETTNDLDAYIPHPSHLKLKEYLSPYYVDHLVLDYFISRNE